MITSRASCDAPDVGTAPTLSLSRIGMAMGANVACWAGQYQHAVTAAHEPHAPDLDGTAEITPSAEHVPKGLQ